MTMHRIDGQHVGGYLTGGDPATWCPHLWQWLVRRHRIRSVLDIGCGEGHSTRFFQQLGCRVVGLDGSPRAIRDTQVPGCVRLHDFAACPFVPDRPFDLIWCCEFVEHVDEAHLTNVLRTFSSAGRMIAMTHAFPGQPGHHHVNCRRNSYWIRHVEQAGFTCLVEDTRAARTVTFADYPSINHFARSGLLFVRSGRSTTDQLARPGLALRAQFKSWQIHLGHRLSAAYRRQMRRRRAYHRTRREQRQAA